MQVETASNIAQLRTHWCEQLSVAPKELNIMIIKGLGRLIQHVSERDHAGNKTQMYDQVFAYTDIPSKKTFQLLSRGTYSKKKNGEVSHLSDAIFRSILQPLQILAVDFYKLYLIHCDLNLAQSFLPSDYIPRPELTEMVISALRKRVPETRNEPQFDEQRLWLTSALTGTGGMGKSVLAAAVGSDPRIEHQFFHGIVWLTVGQITLVDLNERAASLAEYLRHHWQMTEVPSDSFHWEPEQNRNLGLRMLSQIIGQRHVLLIVDDVWDETLVRWLNEILSPCENCCVLLTTRVSGLVPVNASSIPVDHMTLSEARQLLISGLHYPQKVSVTIESLLLYTGKWPLLVKLAKGLIAMAVSQFVKTTEQTNEQEIAEIEACQQILQQLKGAGMLQLQDLDGSVAAQHKNLHLVLHASFSAFKNHDEVQALLQFGQRFGFVLQMPQGNSQSFQQADGLFQSLAIFPEDSDITPSMLSEWWHMPKPMIVQFFALLARFSLVDYFDSSHQEESIRLHDEVARFLNQTLSLYLEHLHSNWLDANSRGAHFDDLIQRCFEANSTELALNSPSYYFWLQHGYHLTAANREVELASWLEKPWYLALRSHVLGSTWLLEQEVSRCLHSSFSDPHLFVFNKQLTMLQRRLPHIAHWPREFLLRDWLDNMLAHLSELVPLPAHLQPNWQVSHRWFSNHLPPANLSRSLSPHYDIVVDCLLLPDDIMVTCSEDGSVRVANIHTGENLALLILDPDKPTSLGKLNEHFYLIGCDSGKVHIAHVLDETPRYTVHFPDESPVVWCDSGDGQYIFLMQENGNLSGVAAFSDSDAQLLNILVNDVRCCTLEPGHPLWIVTEQGELFAVEIATLIGLLNDNFGASQISDIATKCYPAFPNICFIEVQKNDLLVCSNDGWAALWDTQRDEEVERWQANTKDHGWVTLLNNGDVFYLTGEALCCYRRQSGQHQSWINPTGYFGDFVRCWLDNMIVYATPFDTLVVFDTERGEIDHHFNPHSEPLSCIDILQGRLFTGSMSGEISLWQRAPEETAQLSAQIEPEITQCHILSEGYLLTSSLSGGKINLYDLSEEQEGRCMEQEGPVWENESLGLQSLVSFENGNVLSVVGDKWIVWSSLSEQIISMIAGPYTLSGYSEIHALSPNIIALTVVANEPDYAVVIIDCCTGETLRVYSEHTDMVNCVRRLNDGRIVSTSWDNTIHVWSLEEEKETKILTGHKGAVMHVTELQSGDLLSVGNDGFLIKWDINGQRILQQFDFEQIEPGSFGLGCCVQLGNGYLAISGLNRTVYILEQHWKVVGRVRCHSEINVLCAYQTQEKSLGTFFIAMKNGLITKIEVDSSL